uniref:Uncharacterized protein n=1 Tax=Eptatretus burgeri TaxID=7764 RepID=A0A8C4R1K1_EPTBU
MVGTAPVDLDEGLALASLCLLAIFLVLMIVRCVRVVLDPYMTILLKGTFWLSVNIT